MIHESPVVIDGHNCEVFAFVTGKDPEKGIIDENIIERFYIDLERGGHTIKFEWCRGSRVLARIVDIRLEQFQDRKGRSVWLPVYGHFEAGEDLGRPMNTEIVSVMRGSIRINTGLTDDHFRLRFKDGSLIKDGVREFRSDQAVAKNPVNLEQAEEQLRQQIREAETQEKELKATSLARGGGWSTMTWLPWTVALLMTVALCILLIRQRMRA